MEIVIIVVLLLLFGLPYGGYRMGYGRTYNSGISNYGYQGGGLGLLLAIVVIYILWHGHYF